MHKVEFEFACGDFVENELGEAGMVVVCGVEASGHAFHVQHNAGFCKWYHPARLKLTDRRPKDGYWTPPKS